MRRRNRLYRIKMPRLAEWNFTVSIQLSIILKMHVDAAFTKVYHMRRIFAFPVSDRTENTDERDSVHICVWILLRVKMFKSKVICN